MKRDREFRKKRGYPLYPNSLRESHFQEFAWLDEVIGRYGGDTLSTILLTVTRCTDRGKAISSRAHTA
jgi:hypothetical protein